MGYHHENLRQALVEAALGLISEQQDLSSVSLRKVARQVGVSHAAPYRHFADKDALLAAIAQEGFYQLTEHLNQSLVEIGADPLQQLEAIGVAYVQFAVSHPSHYRVMFGAFRFDALNFPSLQMAGEGSFTVLVKVIKGGQAAGMMRTGHSRQLAQVAWSLVHGLAMLIIDRQLPIEDQEIRSMATLATHSLIEGLGHTTSQK